MKKGFTLTMPRLSSYDTNEFILKNRTFKADVCFPKKITELSLNE